MIETMIPKSWYAEAIRSRDRALEYSRQWAREARRLAAAGGWSPFGSHVDGPAIELEFDGKDVAGIPMWERPATSTPEREALISSVASAICRYHDPHMSDRLTPAMTNAEATFYVDALLAVQT